MISGHDPFRMEGVAGCRCACLEEWRPRRWYEDLGSGVREERPISGLTRAKRSRQFPLRPYRSTDPDATRPWDGPRRPTISSIALPLFPEGTLLSSYRGDT